MTSLSQALRPRAPWADVFAGRAKLVGSRLGHGTPGVVSPVEARVRLGLAYGDLRAAEVEALTSETTALDDLGVAFRAACASLLTPLPPLRRVPKAFLVSARVDAIGIPDAIDAIVARPLRDRARTVFFVHPHALNVAKDDAAHAARLARADLVLPDGIGLRVAAAILGVALRHNLNGTDLLPLLCNRLAAESIPLALVGAAKGVADDCAKNLREKHAGLDVPLVSDGFLDDEASRRFADRARALGRAVVLVGMGSPRQEAWALRYLGDIPGLTVVTVGGLFDFFAGRVTRAPIAWRELGLEWAYRLMQEPRRLGARYLIGNPRFVASAIAQRISGRRAEIA